MNSSSNLSMRTMEKPLSFQDASSRISTNTASSVNIGADFPFTCETCLGPQKFMRMKKFPQGALCKLTQKPFTVFQWRPEKRKARLLRTIICKDIAVEKNICQVCLKDLEFDIALPLRDQFIKNVASKVNSVQKSSILDKSLVPTSEINQAFYFQQKQRKNGSLTKNTAETERLLEAVKLYNSSDLNRKKKFGEESTPKKKKLKVDDAVKSVFLSNLGAASEDEIKEKFEEYGRVVRIYKLVEKNSAFVELATVEEANRAVCNLRGKLKFGENKVNVSVAFRKDPYHDFPEYFEREQAPMSTLKSRNISFLTEEDMVVEVDPRLTALFMKDKPVDKKKVLASLGSDFDSKTIHYLHKVEAELYDG
eukprot:maker-scaffold_51-snap-gene-0.9-mRNA-1 protein AED:0.18 eAED:0.18 QI:72/1/1/1/1/1/2/146/364